MPFPSPSGAKAHCLRGMPRMGLSARTDRAGRGTERMPEGLAPER
jgi:hypothetical protein